MNTTLVRFLKSGEVNCVFNVVDRDEACSLIKEQYGDLEGHENVLEALRDLEEVGYISDLDEDTYQEVYGDDDICIYME